jgi:hypothetical protein
MQTASTLPAPPSVPSAAEAVAHGPYWVAAVSWAVLGLAVILTLVLYQRSRAKREWILEKSGSAAMGVAFAVVVLVAGTVSQFYPEEIKAVFPLTLASRSPFSASLTFWLSIGVMVVLGGAYYHAQTHQRRQDLKHTADLVNTLRKMPPENFMRDFPKSCSAMMAQYTAAILDPTDAKIRHAIRVALFTAAEMAKTFDRGAPGEVYGANVLRFQRELPAPEDWSEDARLLYPEGFLPPQIVGALVLDPSLSTRSDSPDAGPVAGLKPIHLVIPYPPTDERRADEPAARLRMLPGAATAYHLGVPFQAPDTADLRSTLGSMFDLSEALISRTEDYFRNGPGRGVRSFVSLPLFAEPGEMKGERIGVLNVESSETLIFNGDRERVEQFYLAIAPVHFAIRMLLAHLEELPGPRTEPKP